MKRSFAVFAPWTVVVLSACGPQPEEVAARFETTFNSNDAEAIMARFADEPFVKVDGESMLNNDEIMSWLSRWLAKKPQMVSTSPKSGAHGRLAWTATIERNDWKALGLSPVPYRVEGVFDRDKVKLFTLTMEETAKAQLDSTLANRNAKWLAALEDAVKTRNAPAVAQLVTDDFKLEVPDAKAPIKKGGITAWVRDLEKQNAEIICCAKKRDEGVWSGTLANDKYRNDLKLETVEIITTPTFAEDGHLRALVIALSPDAKTKIETAVTNAATTADTKHK